MKPKAMKPKAMKISNISKIKLKVIKARGDIIGGFTIFLTMLYVIFVNPSILSDAGMDFTAVMLATILAAGISCILMGLIADLPFALAPGMGLNAFFAYSICNGMGIPWQTALGIVFIDGVIFLLISILPVRDKIIEGIPVSLKIGTTVGIGIFIALVGLINGGMVVKSESTLITIGDVASLQIIAILIGIISIGVLSHKRIHGSLIVGIIMTSIILWIADPSQAPKSLGDIFALPEFSCLSRTFLKLDIMDAMSYGLITIIFTFTFVDIFDTLGTFMGLATRLGLVNERGNFKNSGKALATDAVGTIIGSMLGTSTVTTYVESASCIAEGGRTGLTVIVTGILFLSTLFIVPLARSIPQCAATPALIFVGLSMMEPIRGINFEDITEALPAFIVMIMIPLSYNIAEGLILGIISYTAIKVLTGKWRGVSPIMYILSGLFILRYALV